MENSAAVHTSAEPVVLGASAVVVVKAEAAPDDPPNGKPQTEQQATAALENAPATTVGPVDPSTSMKRTPMSADSAVDISIGENGSQVAGATATVTAAAAAAADKQLTSQVSMGDVKVAVKKEQQGEVHAAEGEEHDREDEGEDDEEDDDEYEGFARRNTAVRGSSRRPEPLPLRPSSVHPAFAGRRPLPKHESPASGRAYGLWDPESVHPAYFGHLRHGGEAAGAAGLSGWAGTGDGGAMDCALRVLRGLTDEGMLAGRSKPERNVEVKEDHGLKWSGGMGIVSWSPKERATVLGLLCEEASSTATALEYMEVRKVGSRLVRVGYDCPGPPGHYTIVALLISHTVRCVAGRTDSRSTGIICDVAVRLWRRVFLRFKRWNTSRCDMRLPMTEFFVLCFFLEGGGISGEHNRLAVVLNED